MDECDNMSFPDNFFNIGNKSFEWVFENKKDYVDFTVREMKNPTKFYKKWKDYCIRKVKINK